MGFNAIFLNPVAQTGFSGSLYSIKDYYQFNPIFSEDQESTNWESFKGFINYVHQLQPISDRSAKYPWDTEPSCENAKIIVIIDLVINHSAVDSILIDQHPEWYLRDEEGEIKNPSAINPANANEVTVWGDLAKFDNKNGKETGLWDYWKELIKFNLELGVDGFRCDAAYQVPKELWLELIRYAKSLDPNVVFLAETLGCKEKEVQEVIDAGFDYIFNSSKYWDYTAPWCIIQENTFSREIPSIAFPESHDTKRLSEETNGRKDVSIAKYFFAALFSKGLMIPIGYEFGFQEEINVVEMTPDDWEEPAFDIQEEIANINRSKREINLLTEQTWLYHIPYPDSNILVLLKESKQTEERMLIMMNKNWGEEKEVWINNLSDYFANPKNLYILRNIPSNPEYSKVEDEEIRFYLQPNEFALIYDPK